jgi:hypothetical protein
VAAGRGPSTAIKLILQHGTLEKVGTFWHHFLYQHLWPFYVEHDDQPSTSGFGWIWNYRLPDKAMSFFFNHESSKET